MSIQRMARLSLAVSFAAGLAIFTPAASAAPLDSWITLKAKLAMFTAANVPSSEVHVDTVNGVVTLHGKVFSEAEKRMAAETVRAIDGVDRVNNILQVVPDPRTAIETSDEDLYDELRNAVSDEAWDLEGIEVGSVSDGVVVLEGRARDLAEAVRAVELTSRYPGVQKVRSNIQYEDDDSLWMAIEETKHSAETRLSDLWITATVKSRLIANAAVPALDVNVDTRDGVVTLFGTVPSEEAKKAAETEVSLVAGVNDTKNALQIVGTKRAAIVEESDETVAARMESLLAERGLADRVEFEVADGVVRLSGMAKTFTEKLQIGTWTRGVDNVRSVKNDLTVQSAS